jgi:hypothetical protein
MVDRLSDLHDQHAELSEKIMTIISEGGDGNTRDELHHRRQQCWSEIAFQESKWNTKVKASRWLNDHWDVVAPVLQHFHPELHGLWRGEFGEINRALPPLIEYIERAERGNVTQQAFFCVKRSVIAVWKALTPNQYAAALIEMIDQRFVSTGDGAWCESAYWLTPAGHRENAGLLRYISWRESDVPVEIRGQVRQLSTAYIRVKAKTVADGKILLPSVPSAVIDAEFTGYLQNADAWNSGGSESDVWRDRRWNAATPAAI